MPVHAKHPSLLLVEHLLVGEAVRLDLEETDVALLRAHGQPVALRVVGHAPRGAGGHGELCAGVEALEVVLEDETVEAGGEEPVAGPGQGLHGGLGVAGDPAGELRKLLGGRGLLVV